MSDSENRDQEELAEQINSFIDEFLGKVAEVYQEKGLPSIVDERSHIILQSMFVPLCYLPLPFSASENFKQEASSFGSQQYNLTLPKNKSEQQPLPLKSLKPFSSTKLESSSNKYRYEEDVVERSNGVFGKRFLPSYELQQKLVDWLQHQMKVRKTVIKRTEISKKALEFSKEKSFKASQNWVFKFFRRHPQTKNAYDQHKQRCEMKKYSHYRDKYVRVPSMKLQTYSSKQELPELRQENSICKEEEDTSIHYRFFNE